MADPTRPNLSHKKLTRPDPGQKSSLESSQILVDQLPFIQRKNLLTLQPKTMENLVQTPERS